MQDQSVTVDIRLAITLGSIAQKEAIGKDDVFLKPNKHTA